MAVIHCASTPLQSPKDLLTKKLYVPKVVMASQNQISVKQTTTLRIRSSPRSKIFEDQSKGIVCYRDETGEITCEGYDEGPRFHKMHPVIKYQTREAEIVELLQRNWLRIVNEDM